MGCGGGDDHSIYQMRSTKQVTLLKSAVERLLGCTFNDSVIAKGSISREAESIFM
jgi:hypothetical protein